MTTETLIPGPQAVERVALALIDCDDDIEDDDFHLRSSYDQRARAAIAALRSEPVEQTTPVADPANLSPVHIRLLQRGARYKWIGLADDAATHTHEVVALGELERAGLVRLTEEELPPGPPTMRPREITDAGRTALRSSAAPVVEGF